MPVTQQLLRTSPGKASVAAQQLPALEDMLSLRISTEEELLDADWSPRLLEQVFIALGRNDLALVVSEAIEGEDVLNPAHPCGGNDPVYSEVRLNDHARVREIAAALLEIPLELLSRASPQLLQETSVSLPDDFRNYLLDHASRIIKFYGRAAAAGQVVVTWWD